MKSFHPAWALATAILCQIGCATPEPRDGHAHATDERTSSQAGGPALGAWTIKDLKIASDRPDVPGFENHFLLNTITGETWMLSWDQTNYFWTPLERRHVVP